MLIKAIYFMQHFYRGLLEYYDEFCRLKIKTVVVWDLTVKMEILHKKAPVCLFVSVPRWDEDRE